MHYPGANYMGPGTHIFNNLLNQKQPTSQPDALAVRHDIEYLRSGEKFGSDLKAAAESDFSLGGWGMKIGLVARTSYDAWSHLLDLPNLHLNNAQSVPDNVYEAAQTLARPLLAKWNVQI